MSNSKDGVDVRALLQAIQRRGGYRPPAAPAVGHLETARTTTEWIGIVTPQQQVTLKRNAMLILNSTGVAIALDTEQKRVQFSSFGGTIQFPNYHAMLEDLVARVLGRGWKVTCGKLGGNEPGPAEVKDGSPERPGEGSSPPFGGRSE